MTDNTQELSEIIREMRYRVLEDNGLTVNGLTTIEQESMQAIIDWHNKRELEARIDKEAWLRIFEATRAAVHATNIAIINTNDAFDAMKNKLQAEL